MQTLSIRYVTPQSRGCERNMDDKQNKLFTDFVGRDVQDGITASNFDSLKDNGFITPENKEFFEDMLRTGWLSGQLSSSGPMTGTIQYFEVNGVNNAVSYVDFGPGVWAVMDIVAIYSGGSGSISFRAYHYNGVTPLEWYFATTTSASLWTFNGDSQFDELGAKRWGGADIDGTNYLQLGLKPSGTFTADSMTFYVVAYRVR